MNGGILALHCIRYFVKNHAVHLQKMLTEGYDHFFFANSSIQVTVRENSEIKSIPYRSICNLISISLKKEQPTLINVHRMISRHSAL